MNELTVILNKSAANAVENVAHISVPQSEKIALRGMVKELPLENIIVSYGMDNVIPNIERAIINPRKLYEYALNPKHPIGRNKAKVFENALGYNQSNTDDLIRQIYEKLPNSKVLLGKVDEYGQRYTIDINIIGPNDNMVTVRIG